MTILRLGDILDSIRRIESYTTSVSKEEFLENFMMQDAVMLQIETIGEATNNKHLGWVSRKT